MIGLYVMLCGVVATVGLFLWAINNASGMAERILLPIVFPIPGLLITVLGLGMALVEQFPSK
jgi:hypothetical protein